MKPASITETPNELTTDIDVASPLEMVRLLRASDAQIFNGYRGHPALTDRSILSRVGQVIGWAAAGVGRPDAAVVIAGAGTSGRLAMFACRTFNRFLSARRRSPNFRYLIAGGDRALIKAQEKAEDDPYQALRDLEEVIRGKRRVLYIGVTCAFAAPYVASQLLHLSKRPGARAVLMGFNPEDRARDLEVENWDKTFADVVRRIRREADCCILNPILGPEPITGSTRMKGGSATKLLLEVIFSLAVREAGLTGRRPTGDGLETAVRSCLYRYEQARVRVYEHADRIAELIELGGKALRHRRHIYYLGSGPPGILGIVDASECPPTFGADFEDVRGYLVGGWRTLLGPERDLSKAGPWYRVSLRDFCTEKLGAVGRHDLVVGLQAGTWNPQVRECLRAARKAGAATAAVQIGRAASRPPHLDVYLHITDLPASPLPGTRLPGEFATKLSLNGLTTGAHVLGGKVYRNLMVDLRISNNKLYHRSIGIIQRITGVSADTAKRCLLRSIYGVDRVTPGLMRAKPSQHVEASTDVPRIVPRALIMAGARTSVQAAERLLRKEPIVRAAVEKLKGHTP
jgi:N-acetylmuramic acid 6-phosphate (MurNAc-6-P) etherase